MSTPTSALDAPSRSARPSAPSGPTPPRALPLPLESYVCRNFLRLGTCPYDATSNPDAAAIETASLPRRRHHGCKFLHIRSAELKPTLTLLVQQGHGYVLGCKDFQCKPEKCAREICKFLHITSEEEATLLQQMHPAARELREEYLRQSASAERPSPTSPTAASEVVLKQPVVLPGVPTVAVGVDHQPKEVCRQFLRGECHRGATCRYLHPPVPTPLEGAPSAQGADDHVTTRRRRRETYEDAALAELQLELERILSSIL